MYTTPQPPIQAFADPAQREVARRIYERLDQLEQVTNLQNVTEERKAPPPPRASLAVTTNPKVPGQFFVRITNPEFLTNQQNRIGAPIRHWLRASPYDNFQSNITDFPVTHQTYFTISELGSGTFTFELRSTLDGKTFNQPTRVKATA